MRTMQRCRPSHRQLLQPAAPTTPGRNNAWSAVAWRRLLRAWLFSQSGTPGTLCRESKFQHMTCHAAPTPSTWAAQLVQVSQRATTLP
jgi:hypothetical protein